eukprot:m.146908 g.146908  ORF g.146908 m.146908 type:complete len:587 (-) comp14157_c0_seq1:309-2069(-)
METSARELLKKFRVADLKEVLRSTGGLVSGTKGTLLQRVYGMLHDESMCRTIEEQYQQQFGSLPENHVSPSFDLGSRSDSYDTPAQASLPRQTTRFIDNPFLIDEVRVFGPIGMLEGHAVPGWDAREFHCRLTSHHLSLLANPSFRLFLRCGDTAKPTAAAVGVVDFFPVNTTWEINGQHVTPNPTGRCKPLEITPFLRKPQGLASTLRLVAKRHHQQQLTFPTSTIEVVIAGVQSANVVLDQIIHTPEHQGRQFVIQQLQGDSSGDIITADEQNVKLTCPLTITRLKFPCRSTRCTHLQCFDARPFLMANEQKVSWRCPICNRHIKCSELRVDDFTQSILEGTGSDVKQVTLKSDGSWSLDTPRGSSPSKPPPPSSSSRQSTSSGEPEAKASKQTAHPTTSSSSSASMTSGGLGQMLAMPTPLPSSGMAHGMRGTGAMGVGMGGVEVQSTTAASSSLGDRMGGGVSAAPSLRYADGRPQPGGSTESSMLDFDQLFGQMPSAEWDALFQEVAPASRSFAPMSFPAYRTDHLQLNPFALSYPTATATATAATMAPLAFSSTAPAATSYEQLHTSQPSGTEDEPICLD